MEIVGALAVVTGAARGIGRATAVALAEAGARAVVLADIRTGVLEGTVELVRKAGAEALAVECDVRDLGALERLLEQTCRRFGGVQVFVNNAGIGEGDKDWPVVSPERVGAVIDTNLRGVVLATRLVLEPMRRAGGGVVVNIASGAAFVPLPPQAVYAATKAAVVSFTRSCAPLVKSHGVRVCCLCPGLVDTEMVLESGDGGPAAWLQEVIDSVKILSPESVAGKILEMIGDDANAGAVVNLENEVAGLAR